MQRKYFILIGAVLLLIATFLYFTLSQPKGEQYEAINTIMGVPVNSEIIVHIPNLEKLTKSTKNKGVWQTLNQLGTFKDFDTLREEFSQILSDSELLQLLDKSQLTIATKITGRNSIEFSYIFPLQITQNKKHIQKLLQYIFKDYITKSRNYSGFKLYHVTSASNKSDYFYAFAKGLFIFSTSQIALEDALLQIHNNNSLLDKESFQQLSKIASANDDANVFINGITFPKLLSLQVAEKYRQFIKELTDFTTQAGIDVSIDANKILLNGFLYSDTNDFFYTNILLNQEPVKLGIEEVIPANTHFWAALSLSNKDAYLDNYKRYLEQTGDSKTFRKFSDSFQQQTGSFPEHFLYPLLDSEIGLVVSNDKILGETANSYVVLRTKSKSETTKSLDSLFQNYAKKEKIKYKTTTYKFDEKLNYKIYPFPFSNFAHMMWGGLFFETATNYCTLIDNYLVFGSSKENLQRYIDYIVRRKTLKHDTFYQSQKKFWIDNESSFVAYLQTGDATLLSKYLKTDIADKFEFLRKFPSASIQIKTIKGMLYMNGYISYNDNPKQAPETVWQSRLDSPLRMKPVMVTNHNTKAQELILQDSKNNLYLISNAGHILWKQPLTEPILGTIHQVDCYKNNKLQYLFNTKSKLYLIDRNGNSVGNFPVNFRSKATNGLALFDYDKNKNYRIFVACEDKKTYLYNVEGKMIEGWEAEKNEHKVNATIQHFINNAKDYIVYNDGYRNYILSRRGELRVLPKQNFNKANGSRLEVLQSTKKQKCSLVATDTTGLIYFTYMDGTVATKKVGKFTNMHLFKSYDLNADGKNDFIFVDKGKLSVFDASGKASFTHSFDNDDVSAPNFYSFSSNDRKIGIRAGGKIYLFNSDGSIYDGFPLEGYSDFTIGFTSKDDRQFNLFVAGNNDLLFNYAVK